MPTLVEVVTTLAESIVEMIRIFASDVAFYDPLSTIAIVFGTLFVAGASAVFGGLVLGAAGDLLGVSSNR
jgi:hypothetical protein